jgi:hypothetical protein
MTFQDEKKLPHHQRIAGSVKRLRSLRADVEVQAEDEDDLKLVLDMAEGVNNNDTLIYDLWNGFQVSLMGHPASIETAMQHVTSLAIVHDLRLIRSIRVYSREKGEYTTKMNYTQIKEARAAERAQRAKK